MKDSSINTFTGILIAGEIQRQNEEKINSEKNLRTDAEKQKEAVVNENEKLKNKQSQLKQVSDDLEDEVIRLEDEVNYYKRLLSRPISEIAEKNENFKKTYEKQMETLAEWMVSQKAFKELAIQFGLEKGQDPETTIKQGLSKKIDVLQDKHDSSHNTNVGDSTIIGPRRHILIKKIISE